MFSIAGSIIGAGFATGKELLLFFQTPDVSSVFLLCLSLLLMCLTALLYFHLRKDGTSIGILQKVFNIIFLLFSGGCYAIMLACGGEALAQGFSISAPLGTIITYVITLLILTAGIEGVYRFNLAATPVLIFAMLAVSILSLVTPTASFFRTTVPFFNALIYSGYNLFSVLPFLEAIAPETKRTNGSLGIVFGFMLVMLAGIFIKIVLNLYHPLILSETLPMMKIIGLISPGLSYLYSIILYLAVLTTAVTCLYSCTKGKHVLIISLCLLAGSFLGFAPLLERLYTAFGYIGILVLIAILGIAFKNNR